MIIEDKYKLLPSSWEQLIRDVASLPYQLEQYGSLEDIHQKEGIDVYIEKKTDKIGMHEQIIKKLMKELDICDSEYRKYEIRKLLNSISQVVRLGEYKPQEKNIYLYVETIMASGGEICFLTTYLHEMMHAYFDRKGHEKYPYIYEREEPLAEAGMLLFLDKTNRKELSWAKNDVKSNLIKEYAFGEELYQNWKYGKFGLESEVERYKYFIPSFSSGTVKGNRRQRDAFENWLLTNGSSQSSAVYIACYLPLLKAIMGAIFVTTKGRTDSLYEVVSASDLNQLSSELFHQCHCSYRTIERYQKVINLYGQYLADTGQIQP